MRCSAALFLAVICLGCSPRIEEARARQLQAQGRALLDDIDRLEERLLVDQARVRFWEEMRARHESVTAIACTGQDRHAEEMARYLEIQQVKREALARRNRVAAVPRLEPRSN